MGRSRRQRYIQSDIPSDDLSLSYRRTSVFSVFFSPFVLPPDNCNVTLFSSVESLSTSWIRKMSVTKWKKVTIVCGRGFRWVWKGHWCHSLSVLVRRMTFSTTKDYVLPVVSSGFPHHRLHEVLRDHGWVRFFLVQCRFSPWVVLSD